MSALLSLEGVSKIYGNLRILDSMSLGIPRGRWVSIVDPSGSGRTILVNIADVMDTATKDITMLDRHDTSGLVTDELTETRCRTVGLVLQQFHLTGHLTALENVMVAQYYHSMPDEKEALRALDRVGLADRTTHLPYQPPGGERQRVCAMHTPINYSELLLVDEPTGNLDETNKEIVLDLFNQFYQDSTALMVVAHDTLVAEQGQREIRLDHDGVIKEAWHDHGFEQCASGLVLPGRNDDTRSGKDGV